MSGRVPAGERRQQLAEAAAELFGRRGFRRVSLADVAGAVGVTAPSLYRHFTDKQDLLAAAIVTAIEAAESALGDPTEADGDLESLIDRLAGAAVRRADLWVLLERERRHLAPEARAEVDQRFGGVVRRVRTGVAQARPELRRDDVDLLVVAVLGILSSPAVYRRRGPAASQRRLLAAAAREVCLGWPVRRDVPAEVTAGLQPQRRRPTRRDQIVTTAVDLFLERGYDSVSLDDVGAACGLTGPSLYYYVETKDALLAAAFEAAVAERADHPAPPEDSADAIAADQVVLAIRERSLFRLYILEGLHLPAPAAGRIERTLASEARRWARAVAPLRPGSSEAERLVLVHAARALLYDVARDSRCQGRPDLVAELAGLVDAVVRARS